MGVNCSNEYDNVKEEMAIMKAIDHPRILKLFEIIDDPESQKLYLILELVKNGSLIKQVNPPPKVNRKRGKHSKEEAEAEESKKPLSEDTKRKYFRQIIQALEYCHDVLKIIHRDIKPDNILINENDDIKLADFGVSLMLKQDGNDFVNTNKGSAMFFSPEACIGDSYRGKLNDIWACGITLFYMASG